MAAHQGLVDVRNAAIARATRALAKHHLAQARNSLALAQALSAPAVQLQPLRARLRDLEAASGDVSSLLAQAARPDVDDATALALLDRVLAMDADNALALEGRRELLARWLVQAEAQLAAGDVAAAQALIGRVVDADPAHLDLPPVQALLGEAIVRQQAQQGQALARATQLAQRAEKLAADFEFRRAEAALAQARRLSPEAPAIATAQRHLQQARQARKQLPAAPTRKQRQQLPLLLAEAEQAMARGDYITPPGTSAWDKLRVAGALAPDSPALAKAQATCREGTRTCFDQALAETRLHGAQSCLEAREALDPDGAGVAEARQRLAAAWLAYAEERIGASDYAEAEKALGFVRRWQPTHPRLRRTSARLRQARGGAH
jgi:tetratricopeptide (TPR) repeat protein